MCVVKSLWVHFIKSCRASSLQEAELDESGARDDRRCMIIDRATGRFVTQRDHPELARVICDLNAKALVVTIEGGAHGRLIVPRSAWSGGERIPGTVWGHTETVLDQGREASDFFSDLLHRGVRLVRTPPGYERVPSRRPEGVKTGVAFPDGCPIVLTAEESLTALNATVPAGHGPYPMENFRSNIVVTGTEGPWDEDVWREFDIGNVHFYHVKRRTRCRVIGTDQRTGECHGEEPLTTLQCLHGADKGGGKRVPLFGISLIHASPGTLRVGDLVRNIVRGPPPEL